MFCFTYLRSYVFYFSVSSVRFWSFVFMQGMTTTFKTSKALKVSMRSLKNVLVIHACTQFFMHCSCLAGQEGGGWECPCAQRWWVGCHVCAGAQSAPAWAHQGGCCAIEAATADPEKPRLCRELPHQTCYPKGGAGETKDRAAAGGGQAGPWECQHEIGVGCTASQVWGFAVFRTDCDQRASLTRQSCTYQRHHHRQIYQPKQLQPIRFLNTFLVLTGLGSPLPAWSFLFLTWFKPTHPTLRRGSVVRLRGGRGGKLYVMLCCIHNSVSLFLSLLHNLHCLCTVQTPFLTTSTGRLSGLCDPTSMTNSRDLLLLKFQVFDTP